MTLERQLATLKAAHQRQVRRLTVIRSLWFLVLVGLSLLYADLFFQLNDPTRVLADVFFVAASVAVAVFTRRWLTRATSLERRLARLIEEVNPEMRNVLVNAIDFEEALKEGVRQPVSTELMERQIGIAFE